MKSKKLYQLRFVALLAVLSLAGAPRLLAQSAGTAGVAGTVTDPSGAAVPQVTVTLTSADTGQSRTAVTGSDGAYRFTLLPPGAYSVRFSAQGFRSADVSGLRADDTRARLLANTSEMSAICSPEPPAAVAITAAISVTAVAAAIAARVAAASISTHCVAAESACAYRTAAATHRATTTASAMTSSAPLGLNLR